MELLLLEMGHALRGVPREELVALLAVSPVKNFVEALLRRGVNLVGVIKAVGSFSSNQTADLIDGWLNGEFSKTVIDKGRSFGEWAVEKVNDAANIAGAIYRDPINEGMRLILMMFVALASSGGVDANGGLPDIDIPLLGIGAHRSPFTHSVLIGAGAEALVASSIRLILAVHKNLPQTHDPLWDRFATHSTELLDSISKGVSIGLAYHLLVDGLVQPAPYHGLPVDLPEEAHQALLAANGVVEGLYGLSRIAVHPRTKELVLEHRTLLAETLEIDEIFLSWVGADTFELLRTNGIWMAALAAGQIAPYTEGQAHFILVAWGRVVPETMHEVAWLRLVNLVRIFEDQEFKSLDRWGRLGEKAGQFYGGVRSMFN